MHYELVFKSILIGLSIAAPVGPIGVLCIQRTLAHGARLGFISGLGAALADGLYGALGALGLNGLNNYLITLNTPLSLAGILFLTWLGWHLWKTPPQTPFSSEHAEQLPAVQALLSVFLLTLSNPMTIMSFIAIFASLGALGQAPSATFSIVFGVTLGSALWWLGLACSVALLRRHLSSFGLCWINHSAGLMLLVLAGWHAYQLW